MPKAVLDRDGTIIRDVHYLKDPKDIELIDGVGHALHQIKNSGYLLFCIQTSLEYPEVITIGMMYTCVIKKF